MADSLQTLISAVVEGRADVETLAPLKDAQAHFVGLAFRRVLFPLLPARDEKCLEVLRVCLECFKQEYLAVTSTNLVLIPLFEDAFDLLPLNMCERVFSIMEENAQQPAFVKANGPRIVRLINGLKRRLSRSQDIELSGRLLMFVASIFPMSDKSGANIGSNVNAANKTVFDETEEELNLTAHKAAEAQKDVDMSEVGHPINKRDYKQFWTLQRFFCEPRLCYKPDEWKRFEAATECVLDLFERHPLEDIAASTQPRADTVMQTDEDDDDDGDGSSAPEGETDGEEEKPVRRKQQRADTTFAKYLTSPKLFELQLNDVTLRREVLLQLLVLFSYLPRESKFKKPSETLNTLQGEWMEKRLAQVEKLMKAAGSDGAAFLSDAKRMLEREQAWVQWKEEGCKPFEKKESAKRPVSSPPTLTSAGVSMGTPELNRLWQLSSSNLVSCKRAKVHVPTLKEYFLDAVEEMDPAECVEEDYWQINDFRFSWKGLRLISRKKINLFHFADQPSLKSYMAATLNILAKDFSSGSGTPTPAAPQQSQQKPAKERQDEDAATKEEEAEQNDDADDEEGTNDSKDGDAGDEDKEEEVKEEDE